MSLSKPRPPSLEPLWGLGMMSSRGKRMSMEDVLKSAGYALSGNFSLVGDVPLYKKGGEKNEFFPKYPIRDIEAECIERVGGMHPTELLFKCLGPGGKMQCGVLMEYLDGDLLTLMQDNPYISMYDRLCIMDLCFRQVARLHEMMGVAHRDIKPENLLFRMKEKEFTLYLIDYGDAIRVDDPGNNAHVSCGTKTYAPPEFVCSSDKLDYKLADAWSLGATLFVILFGILPIEEDKIVTATFQYEHLEKGTYSSLMSPALYDILDKNGHREGTPLYDASMNAFTEVICKLMTVDPKDRMTVIDAYTKMKSILEILEDSQAAKPAQQSNKRQKTESREEK